jgi:hypothetical protein
MMIDHGYSDEVVRGVLGANFRRVYAAVERAVSPALVS